MKRLTPRGRHPANRNAGFLFGGKGTEAYLASATDIDVAPARYAVVCTAHATIMGTNAKHDARDLALNPTEFCEDCRHSGEET